MDNADMPAMPCDILTPDILLANGGAGIPAVIEYHGLTKREHFALELLKAQLIAAPHWEALGYDPASAGDAISEADALLKELDK